MENPFRAMSEAKRKPKFFPEKGEGLSMLASDVDRVWMHGELVEDNHDMLSFLGSLSEQEAAQILATYIIQQNNNDLSSRLASAGITVGELTKNRYIPSGVSGVIRSEYPILLLTKDEPKNFHRPIEIARAIAVMIYGTDVQSVTKFIQVLQTTSFNEIKQS